MTLINQDLMIGAISSVCLFCIGCSFLIGAMREKIPVHNNTVWSKKALRVRKGYKVVSWFMMTSFFLTALVVSFHDVFTVL